MRRRSFLSSFGLWSAVLGTIGPAGSKTLNVGADDRLRGALVLSGGGARGAWEAGVVAALVERHGVKDGQPIPGIDIVCGASIGALNGWMVATAQYSRLAEVWKSIARVPLFTPKREYAAIANQTSGVGTRVGQALNLFRGLVTDVRGVLDSAEIKRWIDLEVDPATPAIIPLIFTVTNLNKGASQLFFRRATTPLAGPAERAAALAVVQRVTAGSLAREATDDILREAIRASAALPILFDPVSLDGPDGPEDFVDGGIANNSPVDVARSLAKTVYTVFLDPRDPRPEKSLNAVEVGIAALGVAQHRVIEVALRSAYVETNLKRGLIAGASPNQMEFLNDVFDVDLFVVHPHEELPLKVSDFTDQTRIDLAYDLGYRRGQQDWAPYSPAYD